MPESETNSQGQPPGSIVEVCSDQCVALQWENTGLTKAVQSSAAVNRP